ncbi:lactosylceramide 1,3-N-acetyl-beta-D-glucosaminyltransferase-like [Argopecten irradians]|uniref:lactosylceramide 1,3-N-acetyl-beta-D-glucosaminyltransferase-like n=1 Tax=Argopecten irradians TaxID=31199 RepID=UPI00371AA2F5
MFVKFRDNRPVNGSLHFIRNEIKRYNDIILMDFHDTYFNNTLKTSTAFNWISEFCPYARFIVLIDDDFFVSLNTLISYLYTLLVDNRKYLYMGRLYEGYEPHRNASSKWYVPVSEYPWPKYPPFIAAGTVIMTMDFVSDVRTAMQYTKPFRLDDVYLAIVAYKLGVTPIHNADMYEYPTLNKNCIASHGYTSEGLTLRWSFHKRFVKRVFKRAVNK